MENSDYKNNFQSNRHATRNISEQRRFLKNWAQFSIILRFFNSNEFSERKGPRQSLQLRFSCALPLFIKIYGL